MIKQKLIITILFGLVLVPIKIVAQIPNYSFENWHMVNELYSENVTTGAYTLVPAFEPVSWSSLNSTSITGTVITCDTTSPGLPGNYYLNLTSRTNPQTGVVIPGIAVCGTFNRANIKLDTIHVTKDSTIVMVDSASLQPTSGFPYTQRPVSLNGYIQYMTFETSGNESGYINVHLTYWDTLTKKRVSIAGINYPLYGMNMEWTNFSIPLTYYNTTQNPDTCTIIISASGYPASPSDYLWIDNLNFQGVYTGIEQETTNKGFNIFPNPANVDEITIVNTNNSADVQLTIVDVVGTLVKSETLNQNQQKINIDGLANGCYVVTIKNNASTFNQKLIIQR